jgi:hypothetical protein
MYKQKLRLWLAVKLFCHSDNVRSSRRLGSGDAALSAYLAKIIKIG